jgi:putative peptidoglycan lipid II flippase
VLASPIEGGYAAYTNAFMFFQLPHGLFAVSVMTALLPSMSEYAVARDWQRFRTELARGLRLTAFVLVPAVAGYLVLCRPLVGVLLRHGVVGQDSIDLVSRVLVLFVAGLAFFSTFQLTLRAFFALQDTRTPFLVNLVATGVNIGADVLLYILAPPEWKVAALAGGFAISYLVGAILLLRSLERRVGRMERARLLGSIGRIALASLVMGAAAYGASLAAGSLLDPGFVHDLAMVVAGVVAGLTVYVLAVRSLGLEEFEMVRGMVGRRLRRA